LAYTPIAQKYLEVKNRADSAQNRQALEADVYNHLYAFFSRYYEDGDFISKRRYSQNYRYVIPYSGEEVYFHWVNKDQYYIKTDETLRNYQWKSLTGVFVRFMADAVNVEKDNVEGAHRYFIPILENSNWDTIRHILTIPFDYRPLTNEEKEKYGRSKIQKKIINDSLNQLHMHITDPDILLALTSERRSNIQGQSETHLEYHLRQYTRRNTSDFFIHKNLESFLARELDFYLKNEVLNLKMMEHAGESASERWFHLLRLIKDIGHQIIQFLAQIEEFQKILWEKKKFVMEINYCIAIHCIPYELHEEIVENELQWKEWDSLSLLGNASDILTSTDADEERANYLKQHGSLMLDTIHFKGDFVDQLLASFNDIDEETDGLLVHGDNWQAPRLLQARYQNAVRCVHLDPPYNTATSGFLYKNNYQHSSWLSMMHDRIDVVITLMDSEGAFLCHIDEHEIERLQALFSKMGIPDGGTIIWDKKNPILQGKITARHEYVLWRTWNEKKVQIPSPNRMEIIQKAKSLLNDHGKVNDECRKEFRRWVKAQNHYSGGEKAYQYIDDDGRVFRPVHMGAPKHRSEAKFHIPLMHPVTNKPCPVPRNGWNGTPEKMNELFQKDLIIFGKDESIQPQKKKNLDPKQRMQSIIGDAGRGLNDLNKLGGLNFPYCHPVSLYETLIDGATAQSNSYVMDHFAGSGTTAHAVINLNRKDQCKRKFILVEVGEQFDTVLLPRIKKVAFSSQWREGKPLHPAEEDTSLKIIKYMRLESYEDALDSIEFEEKGAGELESIIEDYILNYMLKWETKDCKTLLNPAKLVAPFDYQLDTYTNGKKSSQTVEVAETFNYLLGLKIQTRKVYMDENRRYLVFCGETREHPNRTTVIIWRTTADWNEADLERDRKFVKKEKITEGADIIYVNGMSSILGGNPIEPIFKERMFAGVSIFTQ